MIPKPAGKILAWGASLAVLLAVIGSTPLIAAELRPIPSQEAGALSAESDPTPSPKPTPWPTPAGVKGLDVSHWNGFPDFSKLRQQGMRFVFSKATQGTTFVDDTFARHTREAQAAGIIPGAYHFFDYRKGGAAQARHFLSTLRETTGLSRLLPLVVDVETLGSLGTPNRKSARARLHAMIDELYRQTGRYPMIYTSRHMWQQVVGAPTAFGPYPLWVACWKCDEVHLPSGWDDWLFWQVGQFKFEAGPKLDGNVFAFNIDQLRGQRQRSIVLDGAATWTASRTVEADLRGFDGQDVRVAIGDRDFGPWQPYRSRLEMRLSKKQGRQDVRVQLRSFRGTRTVSLREDIRLDSVAPSIKGPKVSLGSGKRVSRSGDRVPATTSLTASDKTSGLDWAKLRATCGRRQSTSTFRSSGDAGLSVQLDRRGCSVKGTAKDEVGNKATRGFQPEIGLIDIRPKATAVKLSGPWRMSSNAKAMRRTLATTSTAGAQARVRFDGSQVAIVARRGPTGGRLKVIIDGRHVKTVDLYAKAADDRRLVSVLNVPKGKHVLKLKATGSKTAKSRGSTVWLDAVLVLNRRS